MPNAGWLPQTNIKADEGANYEKEISIDVARLVPMISMPHTVDNVVEITDKKLKAIKINQVLIGSCANADFEDYKIAAKILKNRTIHKGTRLVISPPSKEILQRMLNEGIFKVLIDAGATITSPGCGACPGSQTGLLGDGEVALTSTNRNFQGRLGNPKSFVYLGSAATCAASALYGKITDPRGVL